MKSKLKVRLERLEAAANATATAAPSPGTGGLEQLRDAFARIEAADRDRDSPDPRVRATYWGANVDHYEAEIAARGWHDEGLRRVPFPEGMAAIHLKMAEQLLPQARQELASTAQAMLGHGWGSAEPN